MYREIFREEAYFIQERFALKIIKRWKSNKVIPSNLKEIYYTYINENRNKKDRLKTYKSSITDLMQEGILTENSMVILEKLREQIGISTADHNNVMRLIKLKNENLFDDSIEKSREKRYQEKSYKEVIENALNEHLELDQSYLKSLQKQFCISDEVHKQIMDSIINNNEKIHHDILNLLDNIHNLLELKHSIYNDGTREINFLKYSIKNEFITMSKDLFTLLFTIYNEDKKSLKILLNISKGKDVRNSFVMNKTNLSFMHESIADKMLSMYTDFLSKKSKVTLNNNKAIIDNLLSHKSIQIATAALLNTKNNIEIFLSQTILDRFCNTNDIDLLRLLYKLKYSTDKITTYERMMYLHNIAIFKNLKLNDLYLLGQTTNVVHFQANHYIIKQGEIGKVLYVLIKGAAIVEVDGKETARLGHREYFGEIALLGDIKRTASVKVTQATTALSINKKEFKLFLHNNPKVSTKVMKEIIKKLI
jgi:CRP-like cAMP-binding protein